MLSYRHGFHAGNFADVLKHVVQVAIIDYLKRKDKPFCYHDSHAGAGEYPIDSAHMQKTGEYASGIARLLDADVHHPLLRAYLDAVRATNPGDRLLSYPGSPRLARQLLRAQDRMQLTELHPADFDRLRKRFAGDRQVRLQKLDAYQGLKSMLPPRERRGLVLIDPSYEIKSEYRAVIKGLQAAHQRFATSVYALWYPMIERQATEHFMAGLARSGIGDMLRVELCVRADAPGHGMTGSGMVIVNPPYVLEGQLAELLPELCLLLEQVPGEGHFLLQRLDRRG